MKRLVQPHALLLAPAALILLLATGCGRDDVKVYHVATNDIAVALPSAAAPVAMPTTMPDGLVAPDNSSQPKLKYVFPVGWKEKALTQMRVASFEVSENSQTADVSVIPMSGSAGGDPANVNRWRGQIGLPPVDEDALAKLAEKVEVAGQPAELYDLAGTTPGGGEPERILGAILHGGDTVWFFKLTGDADLAEKQKANFIAFLKSVDFDKLAAPATLDLSQLPPSHPSIPGMNAGGTAEPVVDATGIPVWTVPADWKKGQLAQFLVAKFVIGSGDATASVNVSQLSGDGGGLLSNINRWRGQLGLTPISEADLAQLLIIDATGDKATVVDISGTEARSQKPAQLVGVVLPHNGQTWFYKLMGNPAVVTAQKAAFIQFVQSAKYPDAH